MNLTDVFFYVFALASIAGAISAVAARNPVRGVMGLMVMIVSIALLYLALSAEFLAAIQLIVYAGAVVVLFIFVIMLLGPDVAGPRDSRGLFARALGGILFAATAIAGATVLISSATKGGTTVPAVSQGFGGADALGRELFTTSLVPFELSSALLMVAVIGAVAVAKGGKQESRGNV